MLQMFQNLNVLPNSGTFTITKYKLPGADKSLAQPGRKQATATKL